MPPGCIIGEAEELGDFISRGRVVLCEGEEVRDLRRACRYYDRCGRDALPRRRASRRARGRRRAIRAGRWREAAKDVLVRHEQLPLRVGCVARRPRADAPNGSRALVAQLRHARDLVRSPQIRPGTPLWDRDVRAEPAMQRPASKAQKHADIDRRPDGAVGAAVRALAVRREATEPVERSHVLLLVALNELAREVRPELGPPHDWNRRRDDELTQTFPRERGGVIPEAQENSP